MQIAPENTMIAFQYAADSNVLAFESDVSIRWELFWSADLYDDDMCSDFTKSSVLFVD